MSENSIIEDKLNSTKEIIEDLEKDRHNYISWKNFNKERLDFYVNIKEHIQKYIDNNEINDEDAKFEIQHNLDTFYHNVEEAQESYDKFKFGLEYIEDKIKSLKEKYDIQE